jgi:2-methylisocitrate lyase-like PEP mutase family enzyme
MAEQLERARAFARLHVPGTPLVLFNVWDAGSARAVAGAGARSLATGSHPVASAHGYEDGEKMPLELAMANLERIVGAVDLPVSVDLEAGYGASPEVVSETVTRALSTGAVGCNLEDRRIGTSELFPVAESAARVGAARAAAERCGVPFFVNARTDLFLVTPAEGHDDALVDAALERAAAWAAAGADGLFVPGLADEARIARLCAASPLPVNLFARPDGPSLVRLAELGAARISHGPIPWRLAMHALAEAARAAHGALSGLTAP